MPPGSGTAADSLLARKPQWAARIAASRSLTRPSSLKSPVDQSAPSVCQCAPGSKRLRRPRGGRCWRRRGRRHLPRGTRSRRLRRTGFRSRGSGRPSRWRSRPNSRRANHATNRRGPPSRSTRRDSLPGRTCRRGSPTSRNRPPSSSSTGCRSCSRPGRNSRCCPGRSVQPDRCSARCRCSSDSRSSCPYRRRSGGTPPCTTRPRSGSPIVQSASRSTAIRAALARIAR